MSRSGHLIPHHIITVISREGCHICENVILDLEKLSQKHDFQIEVLDISSDPTLFDKYWIKVPVVRLDGVDVLEAEQIALTKDRTDRLESFLSTMK